MDKRNQRLGRGGFTLMELLVAVGLMAVMFTALSIVFKQATDLIRRSEAEIDVYQNFRLVSKIIKKDFESIVNYEEPVFYNRCDEWGDPLLIHSNGNPNPDLRGKLDYCGYMRIEGHSLQDTTNAWRVVDNISFLATDANSFEVQNYLNNKAIPGGGNETYVKTNVRGSDLVEISYVVEDQNGKVVTDNTANMDIHKWRLVRIVRNVVAKEHVSGADEARGWFGLIYKGYEEIGELTGKGTHGMDIFNGSGPDNTVTLDYSTMPPSRGPGRPQLPNKYGRRDVIAEGCVGFDVKYWYYRHSESDRNWQDTAWAVGTDDNPDGKDDPYVMIGNFFNGMPPNPACMPTPANSEDDEGEFQYNVEYGVDHPNWWYLPRMMQIRLKLTDGFKIIEQDFWTRMFLPASDPRPRVP